MSIKVLTFNPTPAPTAPAATDRAPDAGNGAGTADNGGFRTAMAQVQGKGAARPSTPTVPLPMHKPTVPLVLENGQTAPPVPAAKPEAPLQLANGQSVPDLPGRKPEVPAVPATVQAAERITQASKQVASLSGHSFTAILAQATQESGLDPAARNTASSAAGPFQFLERTWLGLFQRYGAAYGQGDLARQITVKNGIPSVADPKVRKEILDLRHDVDLAAGMAARYLSEGRERLARSLNRPVSETESRIAYVMGVGGAARLIKAAQSNPSAVAAELMPSAAQANRGLFYDRASGRALTAGETVSRLSRRMENDQGDMFATMSRADEQRQRLDGSPSPLNPFQSAASTADDEGGAVA